MNADATACSTASVKSASSQTTSGFLPPSSRQTFASTARPLTVCWMRFPVGTDPVKLTSPYWRLTLPLALIVSGAAFLVHEQNGWLWSRSAFVHHAAGWTLIVAAFFPLLATFRPQLRSLDVGFAITIIALAVIVIPIVLTVKALWWLFTYVDSLAAPLALEVSAACDGVVTVTRE